MLKTHFPYKYKLNIQLFAEDTEDKQTDDQQQTDEQQQQTKDGQKFFSQEEMDRIISDRLRRQQEKVRADLEKEFRLKNMSKEEREREEFKSLQAEMEQYKREAQLAKMERYAQQSLRTYGIPQEFATFVRGADEDATVDNIKSFKATWDATLAAEVAKRIDGSTPTKPTTQTNTEIDPMAAAFDRGFSF
ncbi:DUF4355 domain-containing protein [Paenibacillus alvei]|uniref:DUF4355 domain-containing protein n=1 Tax=Paenibacillus alvei TaxID=44250 RepID=UPI000287AA1C|nr:DUF4355 domain-containing protein [Paenibacillus alvei]EJW14869.1 hypothetical protein PAV_11c02100 [Paenibacillus alvei DSM 29]MCY9544734.1 DUF4355 domain-containing protein [Paenibacillus alvei]MCY9708388.1 DUF4355 domain-containing protein [Paenibacillus alvei]MEC0083272.1 DUF4355 domain-containing protein [Paenibacillus alvei]